MGQFFADIHAAPASQLGILPHGLEDTPDVAEKRGAQSYDELLALAKALCWQLRYKEAVDVYTKAVEQQPEDPTAIRQRAARYITTLQPEAAIGDFLRCRELGGDPMDIGYRLGICYYLHGNYQQAMVELEACYPLCDEEMGIATIYWHTLSAWKCGKQPLLLNQEYRKGMNVGHHTAYEFAMQIASGHLKLTEGMLRLSEEKDDLEYSIKAYGIHVCLIQHDEPELAQMILDAVIRRDRFWISYAYIAAWNDVYGRKQDVLA